RTVATDECATNVLPGSVPQLRTQQPVHPRLHRVPVFDTRLVATGRRVQHAYPATPRAADRVRRWRAALPARSAPLPDRVPRSAGRRGVGRAAGPLLAQDLRPRAIPA